MKITVTTQIIEDDGYTTEESKTFSSLEKAQQYKSNLVEKAMQDGYQTIDSDYLRYHGVKHTGDFGTCEMRISAVTRR